MSILALGCFYCCKSSEISLSALNIWILIFLHILLSKTAEALDGDQQFSSLTTYCLVPWIGLIKKFEPAVVLDCSDMSEIVTVILTLLSNCLLAEAALRVQPHGLRHWASWRNGHHRTHERAGHPAWEHPPEGSCCAGFPWWCQGVHCYLQETRQVRRRMINTQPKQHNQHGE